MDLIGKPTINPVLFYSGKIAGYYTWIVLALSLCNIEIFERPDLLNNHIIAYCLLGIGFLISIISFLNLGKSTCLGLPAEDTVLKTYGLYKFSRNPMYLGFGLFTLASALYTLNLFVILPGVYSLAVYHSIIKSEESFLLCRFGDAYRAYIKKVRRYF